MTLRAFLLALLLLPRVCLADAGLIGEESMVVASGGTGCPTWNTSTYIIAWNGDYSIGGVDKDVACKSPSGTPSVVQGTETSASYGDDSGVYLDITGSSQSVAWAVTNSDLDYDRADGWTICAEIYTVAAGTTMRVVDVSTTTDPGDNYGSMEMYSDTTIRSQWNGGGATDVSGASTLSATSTWLTVATSYKVGEPDLDHAADDDGGASYAEDDDDLASWAGDVGIISIGPRITGYLLGDDLRIRNMAVFGGYKFDCTSISW